MEKLVWKKVNGERITDINGYVLNYIRTVDRNVKIIVGCDSDNKAHRTNYAITIVFYNENLHHGAHVVYATYKVPKIKDIPTKLWKEAEFIYQVANSLDESLRGEYFYKFDKNFYDGSQPTKLVEVHVDLNPKKNTKNGAKMTNNRSNSIYADVMGWLCACGFKVMSKPYGFASSSAGDNLCRKKK
jgi:predicted RNase H-related nuclease YkuK (DUF458 family)